MERARSSIVLKALGLAIVASTVAFIGGGTANAKDISVTPENAAEQMQTLEADDTVILQPGVYTTDFNLNKPGVTIKGVDRNNKPVISGMISISQPDITVSQLEFKNNKFTDHAIDLNGDVSGLTLDTNYISGSYKAWFWSYPAKADNMTISGNYFKTGSTSEHNLWMQTGDGSNITLKDNVFSLTVQVRGKDVNNRAKNVVYDNNKWFVAGNTAMTVYDVDGLAMTKNTVTSTKEIGAGAFSIGGGNSNVEINDNTVTGGSIGAFFMNSNKYGDGANTNITVKGNTFNNIGTVAIYVAGGNNGVTIVNNTINGNGKTAYGMLVSVSACTGPYDCAKDGISNKNVHIVQANAISGTSSAIVITSNSVVDGEKVTVSCDTKYSNNAQNLTGDGVPNKVSYDNCNPDPEPEPTPEPDKPGAGGEDNKDDNGNVVSSNPADKNEHKDLASTKIVAPQTGVRLSKSAVATNNASASQTDQTIASAMIALMIATMTSIILAGARVVVESKK